MKCIGFVEDVVVRCIGFVEGVVEDVFEGVVDDVFEDVVEDVVKELGFFYVVDAWVDVVELIDVVVC